MEVFIRNVPPQSGQSQLRKLLRPEMERLSIRSVEYNNPYGKTRAFLTFLHAEDGLRFLDHHGQKQREPGARRSTPMSESYKQLYFFGQPIYCEKGLHNPSPIVLRGLAREENERQAGKDSRKANHPSAVPMDFPTSSVSVGNLTYEGSELVFVPQHHLNVGGNATFGKRSMILTLNSGVRIDFIYSAVESITTEIEPRPSFIFLMQQNPRIFEKIDDPIQQATRLLGLMGINGQSLDATRKGPERRRVTHLGTDHQPIVGHCFAYRIEVLATRTIGRGMLFEDTSAKMYRLEKSHETPLMKQHCTRIVRPSRPYVRGFEDFHTALSSLNCRFSFELAFQVQKLVQNDYLPPTTVLGLFDTITNILGRSGLSVTVAVIKRLFNQISYPSPVVDGSDFELPSLIELLTEHEEYILKHTSASLSLYEPLSKNSVMVHRARVTPMGTYLSGPSLESNNRILRKYPEHHNSFLRVTFTDEDGDQLHFNQKVSSYWVLHVRFKEVLERGITIAGRTFTFLGFSSSSLRMHSCWFVAPFIHDDALLLDRDIIRGLGDFTVIRSPAKCAARIGQAFSDTRTATHIDPENVQEIKDVEYGTYMFSDGVGTLSASLLEKIVGELPRARQSFPSCLQIRYKGAKGMVSLDSRLQGDVMQLRRSMIKFDGSTSNDVEICDATYKPLPVYLNRQFIKIMEDMGVSDEWFMDLQNNEVERLRGITESPTNAATFLKKQSIGEYFNFPQLITGLNMVGLDFKADGFLSNVLEVAFLSELRQLKHKTRIPVPKGWHLHGVMDETGLLEEGEIFCVVMIEGIRKVISGDKLLITRAPALHPGDIQLVKGIVPPTDSPLMQLSNCVCFSQKGKRDLPSQLSGGDLDGDRYYVIWDEVAMPQQTFTPAEYPRKTPIDIGRVVTRSDMTDFFLNFMESDQLGRIAVGHRVLADQKERGTLDGECITLAELHSDAVDFSKTGIPPDMSRMPKYKSWRPDFEAPGPYVGVEKLKGISFQTIEYMDPNDFEDEDDDFPTYHYYESDRILGRLYRAIDERSIFEEIQKRAFRVGTNSQSTVIEALWFQIQDACKIIQWQHLLEDAKGIRDITHPHRPLSELEVFAGTILGRDGAPNRHQREQATTMKEQFNEDTNAVVNCIIKDGDEWSNQSLEMSMACLGASLEDRPRGGGAGAGVQHLLSFKYLAAAVCLREVERLNVPLLKGAQLFEG